MEDIFRIGENENVVLGKALPAFIHNLTYHQTLIKIYEDGKIDCWELVNFEQFKKKVEEGWIVTRVPQGEEISYHHLYYGINQLNFYVEEEEFIKEVKDVLLGLQNKFTSSEICANCFKQYLRESSSKNKKSLKIAYNNVPKHLKIYVLGSMDLKDNPIISVLKSFNVKKEDMEFWKEVFLK